VGDGKEWDENEFMMMKVHDITKSMKSISHIVSVAYTKCEYTRTDTTVTLIPLSVVPVRVPWRLYPYS